MKKLIVLVLGIVLIPGIGTAIVRVQTTDGSEDASSLGMDSVVGVVAVIGGLLKTGQVSSYRTGDDGYYQKGIAHSYTDNGDGTITDNVTGLMWAKDGNGPGCNNGNQIASWEAAIDWAEGLTFAGYSDWRLPNRRELHSIVNYGRYNSAIDTTYFPNTLTIYFYWSGTTDAGKTTQAWGTNFKDGRTTVLNKGSMNNYVRAVRGGE